MVTRLSMSETSVGVMRKCDPTSRSEKIEFLFLLSSAFYVAPLPFRDYIKFLIRFLCFILPHLVDCSIWCIGLFYLLLKSAGVFRFFFIEFFCKSPVNVFQGVFFNAAVCNLTMLVASKGEHKDATYILAQLDTWPWSWLRHLSYAVYQREIWNDQSI